MTVRGQTVTILFTDLVGSTELLQRVGDEQAQHVFRAHHRLLAEAVEGYRGHEVKWLGDGLMVAFESVIDAVQCAIAMQQALRRPTAGERLEIRAGLNTGEVMIENGDYFGSPVVIARRLCDRAEAGQIFAADVVVRLLDGRIGDIRVRDLGALQLKGITNTVASAEIVYEHDPMALLRKLPFTGRVAEYETLTSALARARNGHGSIVLLAGEPGVGKTRLTEEFCERAAGSALVIRGNCYEGEVAAPLGPWTEALRALVDATPPDDLAELLGAGAPDIAAMLPQIHEAMPGLRPPPRLDPESERARLFESISVALRAAAADRPLVIFLDDIHWSDRLSLALLEQFARGIADRGVVIIGTYRDVEVDRVHPLAQSLAALRRLEHYQRLPIGGFSVDAVYDLLHTIEPSPEAEQAKHVLAQALHDESSGNPFFIREVLNHLAETGRLAHVDGVWTGMVTSVEELGIPEGVREIIGRRLSRLGEVCNRMLQRASAMTGGFTWDELRAICDDGEDALLDALDEAIGSQIIEERAPLAYTFTHALIRSTLYDELSSPRRALLHRRIADAMEALYAGDLDAHLGDLAAHYMASTGGVAEKAIAYSMRAGDRARSLAAWGEAAEHYQRAIDAMALAAAPEGEQRVRAMLALAECNRYAGRAAESLTLIRTAMQAARALGSPALVGDAAVSFDFAAYLLEDDLASERLALLDEALDAMRGERSAQRVHVLCRRVQAAAAVANADSGASAAGFQAYAGAKDPAVLAQAREAVELAETIGDAAAIWSATLTLHNYGWAPDNLEERRALIGRACAAAEQAGMDVVAWERAMVQLELGDLDAFARTAAEYRAYLERSRYAPAAFIPDAMETGVEAARGALTAAEERWSAYTARYGGGGDVATTSVAQMALLRLLEGRLAELEPVWNAIVTRFPGVSAFTAAHALLYAHAGKPDTAARIIDGLIADDLAAVPRDFLWKATMSLLADACADADHREGATVVFGAMLPYAGTTAAINYIVPLGSMARPLARMAALLERWDDAERYCEMAIEANERMGFGAWATMARADLGAMLLRRGATGDRDRAQELLRRALDDAVTSGMARVEAQCRALLGSR